MCYQQNINAGRTIFKISTAKTIFYVNKDL